jgi:hypothetical protein
MLCNIGPVGDKFIGRFGCGFGSHNPVFLFLLVPFSQRFNIIILYKNNFIIYG